MVVYFVETQEQRLVTPTLLCHSVLVISAMSITNNHASLKGYATLQVETAQGLTIRVINNVSKRMEAKPRFHEAFQKEGCPDAFPYRQKVFNTGLRKHLQKRS